MDLTGKQRRFLRAQAHHLEPIVQVGSAGVTQAVISKLDTELLNHELLKIRVNTDAPVGAAEAAAQLAEATNALVAQVIGRTIVMYRAHPEEPRLVIPAVPTA